MSLKKQYIARARAEGLMFVVLGAYVLVQSEQGWIVCGPKGVKMLINMAEG